MSPASSPELSDFKLRQCPHKISLRFRHNTLDPADITATLGIKPLRCWRAGAPRCTPKGNPLEGTWPQSFWAASLADGQWPKEPLVDALSGVVTLVELHWRPLQQTRVLRRAMECKGSGYFLDRNMRNGGRRADPAVAWGPSQDPKPSKRPIVSTMCSPDGAITRHRIRCCCCWLSLSLKACTIMIR